MLDEIPAVVPRSRSHFTTGVSGSLFPAGGSSPPGSGGARSVGGIGARAGPNTPPRSSGYVFRHGPGCPHLERTQRTPRGTPPLLPPVVRVPCVGKHTCSSLANTPVLPVEVSDADPGMVELAARDDEFSDDETPRVVQGDRVYVPRGAVPLHSDDAHNIATMRPAGAVCGLVLAGPMIPVTKNQ